MHSDLVFDHRASKQDVAFLEERLDEFNRRSTHRDDPQPLRFVVRDPQGKIVAGLRGLVGWDWVYIDVLWVAPTHQRTGLGSRLLDEAESEGRRRNCIGSCLATYSFQARPFYQKRGYHVFGEIEDYPRGETMYFLEKRFAE